MDITRTMQKKRRAVRKLVESFPKDEGDKPNTNDGFKFPPPPDLVDLPPCKGSTDTSDSCSESSSAREESDRIPGHGHGYDHGYRSDGSPPHRLPPIGVFWDIENCQIPHGKSATLVAQAVRERFFKGFREAEFVVVCDVKKESPQIVQELNDAQVNLIHVPSTSKNAADEKLRQSMRRFADIHGFPAAIVLISGDINFASDLCDLRHRKKLHIILLHNSACSIALILCANEHYNFDQFVMPLPSRGMTKSNWKNGPMEVMIWNLPKGCAVGKLRERLRYLSYNCGGRITFITESVAVVRFPSFELATRAHKRMNGEVMFGNQIGVSYPQRAGTLKKESSKGQNGNPYYMNGRRNSQSEQNGCNAMFGMDANHFNYYRSNSLQETTGDSTRNGAENPWFWDISNGGSGSGMSNNFPPGNSEIKDSDDTQANFETINMGNNSFQENSPLPCQNVRPDFTIHQRDSSLNRGSEPAWSGTKSPIIRTLQESVGLQFCSTSSQYPQRNTNNLPQLYPLGRRPSENGTRKSRTPSPYLLKQQKAKSVTSNQQWKALPENMDSEKYFNPIQGAYPSLPSSPIDLIITNLDQSIEPMEMKKILIQIFGEHVMVIHISMFIQSDGNYAASIKVPSVQDAQYAVSQLHRRKIGYKRILISYSHSSQSHNPQFIRWQVVTLLQEVPGHKLHLFKFLKLFESKYATNISLSDLYRLKDVCCITEESTGRMVSLNPDHRNSPSPNFGTLQDVEPYCSKHYHSQTCFGKGWAEQEVPPLPNVNVSLKEFSSATIRLIATHNNALPLSSFVDCYNAECGPLKISENGVPLEHLVTCVDKVELAIANGVKFLKPAPPRKPLDEKLEDVNKCVSPSLVNQLSLFGRELIDLLRTQHHTQLIFNKLIPAYHHHFRRQCRVADYGFTKLIDLLEAIPNIAQVIGEGNRRIVTLSHCAQMKRFSSDLHKALKSQPNKKLSFEELPQVFESSLGKPFDAVDYGLCSLSDLIDQVPESTVVVRRGQINTLSIPRREQTPDEVERMRQFSKEVIELLGLAPQCSILFHQFIPAYHHHYGHQCRVSDFGFTKLIELFEAIPDIVKIEEDGEGEKKVSLTPQLKLFVVGQQISDIVIPTYPPGLPLDNLASTYLWQYGHALKPLTYQLNSLEDLIDSIDTVRLENSEYGGVVVPVEEALVKQLMAQVRKYLLHSDDGKMKLSKLLSYFSAFHASHLTPSNITTHLSDAICIKSSGGEDIVELTETYQVGRRLVHILSANGGHMSLSALELTYGREGGGLAGHPSLTSVLASLSSVASIKGRAFKKHVILNKELIIKKESNNENPTCRPSSTSFLPSQTEQLEESPVPKWLLSDSTPVVNLPEFGRVPDNVLELASSMFSPCKGLLPPSARPPHPSQLPIPIYLTGDLKKNGLSQKDKEGSSPPGARPVDGTSSSGKRKFRLAAQFQTPFDLS